MQENFEKALDATLKFEGGYSDHPLDPGGATNLGITHITLAEYRGRSVTKADVKALSREEAAHIYKTRYWAAICGDKLPAGVDLALFDLAVNSGPGRAVQVLQGSLGLRQNGILTADTMACLQNAKPEELVRNICRRRLGFLQRLASFSTFGRGWSHRVSAIEAIAMALAASSEASTVQAAGIQARSTANAAIRQLSPLTNSEFSMIDTKSILSSRTVWSNIVGITAFLMSIAGHDSSGLDQSKLVDSLFQVITATSFVASSIFRVMATKKLVGK